MLFIFISVKKYEQKAPYTRADNNWRHWTATIAHVQLMIGMVMYFKSASFEPLFFRVIHISMMITAILVITIGSALSKRQEEDQQKFRILFLFFGIALLIILIAIPWPFSPFAQRPFFRKYKPDPDDKTIDNIYRPFTTSEHQAGIGCCRSDALVFSHLSDATPVHIGFKILHNLGFVLTGDSLPAHRAQLEI